LAHGARSQLNEQDQGALEVAIRRLHEGRMPSMRAAAAVLGDLRNELLARYESSCAAKITPLKTHLPNAA
jgi:hypothetical protein